MNRRCCGADVLEIAPQLAESLTRLQTGCVDEQLPLSELVDEVFEAVPQVLVNVALPQRRPLTEMLKTIKVIQSAEKTLGSAGRVLVRWSGTEPKLRVMVEGPNASAIRNLAKSIANTAEQELRA